MKISKKKVVTTGLAVALAAAMVLGGGTYAYLQGTTDDVVNNFNTNKVLVDLSETTGSDYNIIPGTEQSKDPTITVNNTVPSYVYAIVTDNTDGLVDYTIAEGWTELEGWNVGATKVYYRTVEKDADPKTFPVLKDNKVTYDAALDNDGMLNPDGSLKDDVNLTFTAHAIQKDGFTSAKEAFENAYSAVSSTEDLTTALQAGKSVVLTGNVEVSADTIEATKSPELNLNGKTLTINEGGSTTLQKGQSLTIENGTLNYTAAPGQGSQVAIALQEDSELTLKNVAMTTPAGASPLFVSNGVNKATLNVIDSEIKTNDNYCISTNASNNQTGQNITINVKNSTLVASHSTLDTTAILFNIPGTLNIENSKITADRQTVVNRCGTVNITNSTLTCTAKFDGANKDKYENADWGSGNEVPMAALVVGNRSNPNSYPYDATATLSGVTFDVPENFTEIYAAAFNGHTTTISNGGNYDQITAASDDNSTIIIK
ncbi:hypothetical protein [Massilioclostridium coli]|uniref:hypothetical protein n=1 Tax=Massilioclostridium coli TaxID=1870991 RepID=UPI0022E4ECC1|nr:hypothetical protein [Massilioclostridium coli]